jgi:hypothetical protein
VTGAKSALLSTTSHPSFFLTQVLINTAMMIAEQDDKKEKEAAFEGRR